MSLFQKSVEKKYLNELDSNLIDGKYNRFLAYFGNSEIQENIRNSKEEQFQEGFLRELFVKILDYTLNPEPQFNLTTEFKNIDDSKKADGAILSGEDAIAIIELKSTETTDLDKVEVQAFGYKHHQPKCIYVVISNFEKLRFYIENAVDYIEFDLFNLTRDQFGLLWLCLSKDSLLNNLPLTLKKSSVLQEENITKKLYTDYSKFREQIFGSIVENNPDFDELLLFNKTQKLLDRFLFIFFAEDRLLLPPNSISEIVKQWTTLKDELDAYAPLYDRFKKYFGYLNTGYKGQKYDIFPYNGGLFLPDEVLDKIKIDDDILYEHTLKLSAYDFETEVDVNILGHIFEHSLSEIENVQARLRGEEVDKAKTKRKKDGIFYTPKYITKYIVENTVGKLCEEKRQELGIFNEEYAKGRKNRKKDTIKALDQKLTDYRDWLLTLTILDPACGSGAFLNQALDFLIQEHCKIDDLRSQLLGGEIVFSDISTEILEKNIYGVDLNKESVEIAKLSLWLRTAQKGRKLNTLSNNIKCGNSIVDDTDIAGEKAFDWHGEFAEVFFNGGFDVVIGNPPYVDVKGLDPALSSFIFRYYQTAENRINLYSVFLEKGFSLLKSKGTLAFIIPNSILVNSSYSKIRNLLIDHLTSLVKLPDGVFEDAIVETIIFELQKDSVDRRVKTIVYPRDEKIAFIDPARSQYIEKSDWQGDNGNYNIYVNPRQSQLLKKIERNSINLIEIADFTLGISPYDKHKGHSQDLIKTRSFHSSVKLDGNYKPLISGDNIVRYIVKNEIKEFIKYGEWLGRPREERFFQEPRIIVRQIISGQPPRIYAGYSEEDLYFTHVGFGIIPKPNQIGVKALLGILNSKMMNFYHMYSFLDLEKELFQKILIANCKKFPINNSFINSDLMYFESKVDLIIEHLQAFDRMASRFEKYITSKLQISVTRRMQKWFDLSFNDFAIELGKSLKMAGLQKLTKSDEIEWMDIFEEKREEVLKLKVEMEEIDYQIDQMVYQLYGLTEEEIKIVEENCN